MATRFEYSVNPNRPSVAAHFDRVADRYGRFRRTGLLGVLRRQEDGIVRGLVNVQRGDRVLDAGCGPGDTMLWLAGSGARPFGVDLAAAMVAQCRRRGLLASVQDIEQLGLHAGFDWVLCVGSLEFTAEPRRALEEFAGCLRPGGRMFLLFPRRNWLGILYAAYHRAHRVPVHLFSHAAMRRLLIDCGFSLAGGFCDGSLSTGVLAERSA